MNNHSKKTRAEVREEKKKKDKIKQKKGGTLAGQVLRTWTLKKYGGSVKKMKTK